MALSSAWDLVTTSVSFFALAADAALFGPAAALAGAEEVVEVLGFAGASGACLDFTDFETRSEEHTSELQSQSNLVCRLLLEKKKKEKEKYKLRYDKQTQS